MSLPEAGYGFTVLANKPYYVSNLYERHKIFIRGHSQVEKPCKIVIIIRVLSPEIRYMTLCLLRAHLHLLRLLPVGRFFVNINNRPIDDPSSVPSPFLSPPSSSSTNPPPHWPGPPNKKSCPVGKSSMCVPSCCP